MTQIPLESQIQDHQIFRGRLASHLFLRGQDGFLDLAAIDVLKDSAKVDWWAPGICPSGSCSRDCRKFGEPRFVLGSRRVSPSLSAAEKRR